MREVLQTRNRACGPKGVPTTSRQTSATRTDTTSRLPISLGSTNKRYEPFAQSTEMRPGSAVSIGVNCATRFPNGQSDASAPERIEQGDQLMSKPVTISPEEAADRLAIRELVEAYAHCADRRDAKGQMALFTPDTHFVVYMNT